MPEQPQPEQQSTPDLASWAKSWGFELGKYLDIPQEAPSWWAGQLERRLMFLNALREREKRPASWGIYALHGLPHLLREPLAWNKIRPAPRTRSAPQGVAVRMASLALIEDAAMIIPQPPENASKLSRREYHTQLERSAFEERLERGMHSSSCLVTIDLTAPDDLIHIEMTELVSRARQQTGFKGRRKSTHRSVSRAEFSNWRTSQILPYIDVKLAALFTDYKITNSQLAGILFPGASAPLERLKTPQKQFKKVMRHDLIRILFLQGAADRNVS